MPPRAIPYLKAAVHLFCINPVFYLVHLYRSGMLANQADPVNFLTHYTGDWALWILLADLAITPVRRLSPKLAWLIRFRRMVGEYAFLYATLHLLIYIFLFSGYDVPTAWAGLRAGHLMEPLHQLRLVWPTMLDDLKKRWFIQIGLLSWLILLALAVTSPQRVLRAMGGKNWQRLHRLVYVAGIAACLHYWLLVKAGVRAPLKDTVVLSVLLLARIAWSAWKKWGRPTPAVRVARAA